MAFSVEYTSLPIIDLGVLRSVVVTLSTSASGKRRPKRFYMPDALVALKMELRWMENA